MPPTRVVAFVDGFNLYHAIDDLNRPHYCWLDLRKLCAEFAPVPQYDLRKVYYFSAYARHRANVERHEEFVKALRATGVLPVLGTFKKKDRQCFKCRKTWQDHEEKQTDVNLALYLYRGAVNDEYDRALLVTGDSDITPAVRFVTSAYPEKTIRIIAPPERQPSSELLQYAGGKGKRIKRIHLDRCLLPQQVVDGRGAVIAIRPSKYDPPAASPPQAIAVAQP